ncbi:MAG: nucleotide exchange factor GrpE [Terrimicrobiaceae bacterium]
MKSFKSDSEIEFVFDPPTTPLDPGVIAGPNAAPAEKEPEPLAVSSNPDAAEEIGDEEALGEAGEKVGENEPGEQDEEDVEEEAQEDEEEAEDPHGEILVEIRDELAATSTENRRNTRRIFDALKQFGGILDALSATVNDIHSTARAQAQPAARATDQAPDIIELADRVDRIAAAFAREPSAVLPWWPPARRAIDAWRADRARLGDSFAILSTHVRALLKNSGVERIACEGGLFDPSCMRADEAVLDSSVDDHTVLAEILPGWRESASGRVVRPAHVRVSRAR